MEKAGSHRLFVYGTLLDPQVQRTVIGRTPENTPARLKGFKKYRVRDEDYPGIVEKEDASVNGLLLDGLTDVELVRVDKYEGEEYERIEVVVTLEDGTRKTAYVYRYRDPDSLLIDD